jgi:hypothetical protein
VEFLLGVQAVRLIIGTRAPRESPLASRSFSASSSAPTTASKEPKELLLGKDGGTPPDPRSQLDLKAREPHIDIAEVIGSIPIAPTTRLPNTASHVQRRARRLLS